jgi:hypothetical protein
MGPMDDYTDKEAARLSSIMVDQPHFAADELRSQLSQLDPQSASVLIAKTKNDETFVNRDLAAQGYGPSRGDLQIQVEFDQNGYDSGFRNVTMATPQGIEQVAEIQAQPMQYGQNGYTANPLAFAAGVIVGDLFWQRNHGLDFGDPRFYGWCNREQGREQYWNQNNASFVLNWGDPNYRQHFQGQNWQQAANNPTVNNTYINNTRINTTTINQRTDITTINNTINNTRTVINAPHQTIVQNPGPVAARPSGYNGELPRATTPTGIATARPGYTGELPRTTAQTGVVARPAAEQTHTYTPAAPAPTAAWPGPGQVRRTETTPNPNAGQEAANARAAALRLQQEQQNQRREVQPTPAAPAATVQHHEVPPANAATVHPATVPLKQPWEKK